MSASFVRFACLMASGLLLVGCGSDPKVKKSQTFIDHPLEEFPLTLSEVGLYGSLEDRTLSDRVFEYSPRFPLWTNGLSK